MVWQYLVLYEYVGEMLFFYECWVFWQLCCIVVYCVWEQYCLWCCWIGYVVLQFVVDEVVELFCCEFGWYYWCDEIGDLQLVLFVLLCEQYYCECYVEEVVVK